MLPQLLFGYFAIVILLTTIIGITRRNLIHALLWILLMFVHLGGIYLLLNAEFIAMVQIIVYAGAILVMFLFVIFLMDLKEEIKESIFIHSWFFRTYICLLFLFFILTGVFRFKTVYLGNYTIEFIEKYGHTKVIGISLFNDYLFPLLILGLILIVPLIGVGLIALRRKIDGSA